MHACSVSALRSRLGLLVSLVAVAACGGAKGALEDAAVVAVPGDTLTTAALRDILLQAPAPPTEDASIGAISIWTDLAVVVHAVQSGATLVDDATLETIMRPVMMEGTIQRYGATRQGTTSPSAAQIDSVTRGVDVKVFRRFIIGPVAATDSSGILAAARRLVRLKEQVAADGSVEAAMRSLGANAAGIEASEPQATHRSEMDPKLAAAIWQLNDNEMSDPVVGNGGIQVFQRVPNAAARPAIVAWLSPVIQRQADAVFIDSIVAGRHLAIASDGASRLRAAASEPGTFASDAALATWDGGELTPADARTWMSLIPAAERARMRNASDTSLTETLTLMGRREILFELAVGAGVDSNAVREEVLPVFRQRLTALVTDAQAVGNATAWFRDVLEGRRPFQPLPGALASLLRDQVTVTVNDEARGAALREAVRTWSGPGTPQAP